MSFTEPALMDHQKPVAHFIASQPRCAVWLDAGYAKTLATLTALSRVRPAGHILVIAPLAVARSTWVDEIHKWGFPLRHKSLIMDSEDRELSYQQRMEAFAGVFTDPPTMYFINFEMLTQPSRPTSVLVPEQQPSTAQISTKAKKLYDFIATQDHTVSAELIQQYRQHHGPRSDNGKPLPKSWITSWLRELTTSGSVIRKKIDCQHCQGEGCRHCQGGLIDQMPRVSVPGQSQPVIQWPFDTVIIDESQELKNPTGVRFLAMKKVMPATKRVIELSGTPSPQGSIDLWSQIYLLDQGAALGKNITTYRKHWFTPFTINDIPVSYRPNPGAEEEINARINHLAISTQNADIPMPEVNYNRVSVTMPAAVTKAYQQFERELVIEFATKDDKGVVTITGDNAGVMHGKLMQFASGTLYTGENHENDYEVIHTEKLQLTDYLLRNTDGNVIVAYRYKSDKTQLLQHLRKKGYDVGVFDGSRKMVADWNAGKIPVMLLQPASARHGVNLQHGGHTLIWYTLPDSYEHYHQANRRLIRIGQPQSVTIHELVTKGTRDAKMPGLLQRKHSVQQNLLDSVSADIEEFLAENQDIEDLIGGLDINPL